MNPKLLSLLATGLFISIGANASAQTRFQLGHSLSANSHYQVGAETFANLIEEGTDGRYTVEIVPAGALGSEREMVEGVQLGTVDLVLTSLGTVGSFVPETNVLDLPFLFENLDHARRVIDGPVGEELSKRDRQERLPTARLGRERHPRLHYERPPHSLC